MVNLLLCVRWPPCVHPAALCVTTTAPTLCVPVRSNRAHRSVGFRGLVCWGSRAARVRTAPRYGAQRPHAARSEPASALPPATGRSVRTLSPHQPSVPAQHPPIGRWWNNTLNTLKSDYKFLKINQCRANIIRYLCIRYYCSSESLTEVK